MPSSLTCTFNFVFFGGFELGLEPLVSLLATRIENSSLNYFIIGSWSQTDSSSDHYERKFFLNIKNGAHIQRIAEPIRNTRFKLSVLDYIIILLKTKMFFRSLTELEEYVFMKVPVLVEASATVLRQMLGEDSLEWTKTLWCLDITDASNNDHWWGFNDGNSLDGFLLVQLWSQLVDITNNVGHTSFVPDESGQVDWLGWVILWECLALTTVTDGSLFWEKSQRTVSWMFKFTMRLFIEIDWLVWID